MDCCKLLVIASILCFGGISGQLRFQRYLNITATTQNGLEQGLTDMNGLSHDVELTSDNGDVVLQEPHVTVDVELSSNGKLTFKVCSNGCTNKEVFVCYDAAPGKYNKKANVGCGEKQCGIKAGVKYVDEKKYFYFMIIDKLLKNAQICGTAEMASSRTTVFDDNGIESCEPVKHDGNVVRLYVKQAFPGCSIKVLNAKRWFPTTTAPPTTAPPPLSTPLSSSNTTGSSSSNANTTWWTIGGIFGGLLVLLIIGGIGFCIYQRHQQKKAAAKEKSDRKRRVISPESLPTLDLTPYLKKEEEKPKKEEVKKDKAEKKKNQKKVEVAPAKVMPSKEPTTEEPKIGPSKEKAAADRTKVEASKEKAAPEIKEVQKEKKAAAPPKEHSKKVKKHVKKDVPAVAAPPPPRPKPATPKQRTVDTTQEETPSLERPQPAFEDGSSSPSIENKAPKKPSKKTPAKKPTPPRRASHLLQVSKKAPRHHRYPWRMNSEEWKNYQEQLRLYPRSKVIEWNSKSSSNHR